MLFFPLMDAGKVFMGIVLRTAFLPGPGLASIITFASASTVTGLQNFYHRNKAQIATLMMTSVICFVFLVT